MKISGLRAEKQSIILRADTDGEVWLKLKSPAVYGGAYSVTKLRFEGGRAEIDRFEGGRDMLFAEFQVFKDNAICEGARFVTEYGDIAENTAEYPQPDKIKTVAAPDSYSEKLGLKQGLMNINLPCIMTVMPKEDDIGFVHNGKKYYFIREEIEQLDASMRARPMTTMILLNSPRLFGSKGEKPLLDACIHPGFDWNCDSAFISAFNTQTEEGMGFFGAFVEFLAERYTRPDKKYGLAIGAIVSNEVDSQYVWGNAGEMSCERYTAEYTRALRLAYQCGRKHASFFRVYISLDQYWYGVCHRVTEPMRYYPSRGVVEQLNKNSREQGNFPWGIAYHPYPEDLRWPDFWHDRAVDFTFTTPKITFKNMEVLEAFLAREEYLYNGKPRRIIFSEQGFNSQSGELKDITEKMAAAGYVLAYLKARNMKTVDLFTHHAFRDNPHEFGLNLGMFRYDEKADDRTGEAKPIFESFTAMDTPDEPAAIARARAFIGEDLFDYILNPPLVYGDRDDSKDNEFG